MKNKIYMRMVMLSLTALLCVTIFCSCSLDAGIKKEAINVELPIQENLPDVTMSEEEKKQEAIELIKAVYEIKAGVISFQAENSCMIEGKKCYEVYVYAKNEFTTTTLEIFAVDIESNIVYFLDRVTGKYGKFATVQYKDEIDKYLDTIMSSPRESSNTGDYIKEHRIEYDAVISLGDEALPYLKSIWDNGDHGLRGMLALALCKEIHPGINIVSSDSPDSRFHIETFGIDTNITAAGLYPAKGIRLIEKSTKKTLWEMTPGYYATKFLWSPDSRYVAIYYEARIYGETVILDTEEMNLIAIPGIAEIKKESEKTLTEQKDRPDPYFKAKEWLNDSSLKVEFRWTGENDVNHSGTYIYDAVKKEMRSLAIDE